MTPQVKKAAAMGRKPLKMVSIMLLKTKPIKAVGSVPTIIKDINLPFSDLKSPFTSAVSTSLMDFRKKRRITTRVPTCKVTSKSKGKVSPRSCSVILRWPVLEMGSHSVTPWMKPSIIACIESMQSPLFSRLVIV